MMVTKRKGKSYFRQPSSIPSIEIASSQKLHMQQLVHVKIIQIQILHVEAIRHLKFGLLIPLP